MRRASTNKALNMPAHFNPHRVITLPELAQSLELDNLARYKRYLLSFTLLDSQPAKSFPKIFPGNSSLTAFYRFIRNPNISMQSLLEPHIEFTIGRMKDANFIVVAHDTTTLKFRHEFEDMCREGFEKSSKFTSKMHLHISYAAAYFENTLVPLGVVAVNAFHMTGDEDSSYNRWTKQSIEVDKHIKSRFENIKIVHLMDREADAFHILEDLTRANVSFAIRMCHQNRILVMQGEEHELIEYVTANRQGLTKHYSRTINLSSRSENRGQNQKKKHPTRKQRTANVSIYGHDLSLKSKSKSKEHLSVFYAECVERSAPQNEIPIYWGVFCSQDIKGVLNSEDIIDMYAGRWIIEELNKALKTGCSIEARQAQSWSVMENVVGMMLPIAHRILQAKWLYHVDKSMRASKIFSEDELELLTILKKLEPDATTHEAIIAVAEMGGYIKRKNSPPGWQTIAAGFESLFSMLDGYLLAKRAFSKKLYDG